MNGAYLHLVVNHISPFALLFGTLALVASMIRKSTDLRVFATVAFVITGISAWISVETGEQAADLIKTLGGENGALITTHALAATWALRSGLLIAALAVAMEWAIRKKQKWVKSLQWLLLIFSLHGTTVFAMTAWHGGRIRHTEIR